MGTKPDKAQARAVLTVTRGDRHMEVELPLAGAAALTNELRRRGCRVRRGSRVSPL